MLKKMFPAKVLLFGEYTILSGSHALALPFLHYSGRWAFDPTGASPEATRSRDTLRSFLGHEQLENYIHREELARDIQRGLWFDSSIPHGYGLGSSGALIAAIFDSYGISRGTIADDKLALARLEDYFHGSSSGLDPLVSHLQKPLLIQNFNQVDVLETQLDLRNFFLVDTGRPRQTGPLVKVYQEKLKDSQFKQGCVEVMTREVNFAIEALRNNNRSHLSHHFWHISKLQWDFFPEMIPTQMRGIWTMGLDSGEYILKLCGAGGGGFLLGYSDKHDVHGMQSIISSHELKGFA